MGDILGGIFGSGKNMEQETEATAETAALNKVKLQQLRKLFKVSDMADYASPNAKDFTLSDNTQALIDKATDPAALMSIDDYMKAGLEEGSNYINKVATPEIMSTLALQGMERSGAAPEAIGKATAGIALPFLQSLPGFMQASTGQAAGLASLSDMPRQLRAEDYLRRQGVVQTGLTQIPFSPTSRTEGGENSLPLFHMFGMG
jgi:hypothetical protein